MRTFFISTTLLLSLCILASCNKGEKLNLPLSRFSEPFPKRSINFEKVLGSEFSIICDSDTIQYSISFDRKSRLNEITAITSYDTSVHKVAISRFRDLYILNFKTHDSLWWYSAIQIDDSTIIGMGDIEEQVLRQMFIVDSLILNTKHRALLQKQYEDQLLLKSDKKEVYQLYKEIIKGQTACKIIIPNKTPVFQEEEVVASETSSNVPSEEEVNLTIYPNPAQDIINIKTDIKIGFFAIKDENDDTKMATKISSEEIRLDIHSLKPGVYYAVLADPTNAKKVTKRFVKN